MREQISDAIEALTIGIEAITAERDGYRQEAEDAEDRASRAERESARLAEEVAELAAEVVELRRQAGVADETSDPPVLPAPVLMMPRPGWPVGQVDFGDVGTAIGNGMYGFLRAPGSLQRIVSSGSPAWLAVGAGRDPIGDAPDLIVNLDPGDGARPAATKIVGQLPNPAQVVSVSFGVRFDSAGDVGELPEYVRLATVVSWNGRSESKSGIAVVMWNDHTAEGGARFGLRVLHPDADGGDIEAMDHLHRELWVARSPHSTEVHSRSYFDPGSTEWMVDPSWRVEPRTAWNVRLEASHPDVAGPSGWARLFLNNEVAVDVDGIAMEDSRDETAGDLPGHGWNFAGIDIEPRGKVPPHSTVTIRDLTVRPVA
jgi:hypothetical protein